MKCLVNILMFLTALLFTGFGFWCINRSTTAENSITAARIYHDVITGHIPAWVPIWAGAFLVAEVVIRLLLLYYKHHSK